MKIIRPRQIAAARRNLGLTQSQLAHLMGCSQQYVSRIERAKERHCSDRFAIDLRRRLQLDPAVFAAENTGQPIRIGGRHRGPYKVTRAA